MQRWLGPTWRTRSREGLQAVRIGTDCRVEGRTLALDDTPAAVITFPLAVGVVASLHVLVIGPREAVGRLLVHVW
jgi:hypothetical protein